MSMKKRIELADEHQLYQFMLICTTRAANATTVRSFEYWDGLVKRIMTRLGMKY